MVLIRLTDVPVRLTGRAIVVTGCCGIDRSMRLASRKAARLRLLVRVPNQRQDFGNRPDIDMDIEPGALWRVCENRSLSANGAKCRSLAIGPAESVKGSEH